MTNQEAVLLADPTAKLNVWFSPGERRGFWVQGSDWETKVTYSEPRAWELAVAEVAKIEVSR
jgi:hypothetical protein